MMCSGKTLSVHYPLVAAKIFCSFAQKPPRRREAEGRERSHEGGEEEAGHRRKGELCQQNRCVRKCKTDECVTS